MNSEQDETTAVKGEDTSSEAYHDHQDREDARDCAESEPGQSDSKDYVKADQETADEFLRHFGLPDSNEVRKRAQEDAEARARGKQDAGYTPIIQNVMWMVSDDGTPFVQVPAHLLPGAYEIDDIEVLIAKLQDAVNQAKKMAAMFAWLRRNEVDEETIKKLLLDANDTERSELAKGALLGMTFGGMFGKAWS